MNKKQINNIFIWFAAIILILIIMTPGLWVVLTAFRPQVDVMAKPAVWIPRNLNLIQFETMLFGGSEDQWDVVQYLFLAICVTH